MCVAVRVAVAVRIGVGVIVSVGVAVGAILIESAFCVTGVLSNRPEKISKPKQTRLKVIKIETNWLKRGRRLPKTWCCLFQRTNRSCPTNNVAWYKP